MQTCIQTRDWDGGWRQKDDLWGLLAVSLIKRQPGADLVRDCLKGLKYRAAAEGIHLALAFTGIHGHMHLHTSVQKHMPREGREMGGEALTNHQRYIRESSLH